jgi:hypothetical protein
MSVLYVGAYAWSSSQESKSSSSSSASTNVSGVSMVVSDAPCFDCTAVSLRRHGQSGGANAYGGSMSVLYVGAYAWGFAHANSRSASAGSIVNGISISVSNAGCSNCIAVTSSSQESAGANAYGGSMSVLYVGAYAWSSSPPANSFSASEATTVSDVHVSVSNASCSNCSAVTTSQSMASGANAYGGSMSVLYVGAYAWSSSQESKSSSSSASTNVSGIMVIVDDAPCFRCRSFCVASSVESSGANAYGGSMSVLYVGAYAWSFSNDISSSASEATTVSGVHVSVSNASCSNCSAVTTSDVDSNGANAYGGSMSVLYVGAYAWSFSTRGDSSSASEATTVSGVHVSVSNAGCSNCSAVTSSGGISNGANAYGGSMSVLVFGAHAFSFCLGQFTRRSLSHCGPTKAFGLNVSISSCAFSGAQAMTRAFWHRYTFHHHQAHSDMFQERLAVLEMPTFVSISLTAHCKDIAAITLARLSASC